MNLPAKIRAMRLTARDNSGRFARLECAIVHTPSARIPTKAQFFAGDRILRNIHVDSAIAWVEWWQKHGIKLIKF